MALVYACTKQTAFVMAQVDDVSHGSGDKALAAGFVITRLT